MCSHSNLNDSLSSENTFARMGDNYNQWVEGEALTSGP